MPVQPCTKAAKQGVAVGFDEPPFYRCDDVEIFEAGTHRGKTYTSDDLGEIVRNFDKYETGTDAPLQPPVVLGHEEDQKLLERSDLPAAGWVKRLWRDGAKLKADFGEVPAEVAKWINARSYRKVSAEIYDEPPDGVPGHGKMLRRVALLGAELPQVKTLADLPIAYPDPVKHSERAANWVTSTLTSPICFSEETRSMDRTQLLEKLVGMGFDAAVAESLTDEQLAEFVRVFEAKAEEPKPEDQPTPPEGNMADTTPAATAPAPTSTPAAQPAGPSTELPNVPVTPTAPVMPQTPPSKVTLNYSEVKDAVGQMVTDILAEIRNKVAETDKTVTARLADEKKVAFASFCERLSAEGKLPPALLQAGLVELACSLDATKLSKFAEKEVSQLDALQGVLEAMPVVVSFAERLKDPLRADVNTDVAQVEKFYEDNRDQFAKVGTTKDHFVGAFKVSGETAAAFCK